MKKHGKNYVEASKLVDKSKVYSVEEAIKTLKSFKKRNFDETVEVALKLNIDAKKTDMSIRNSVVLPNGTGKSKRILVVTKMAAKEAKEAGADYVGDMDMIEKIEKENWFDFDVIVATPDMMAPLGKIGKVLGPKGLMPNPKTGTVNPDIARAVKEIKAGKVEYRVDKEANMHVSIARVSFDDKKIEENR